LLKETTGAITSQTRYSLRHATASVEVMTLTGPV